MVGASGVRESGKGSHHNLRDARLVPSRRRPVDGLLWEREQGTGAAWKRNEREPISGALEHSSTQPRLFSITAVGTAQVIAGRTKQSFAGRTVSTLPQSLCRSSDFFPSSAEC